jgi:cytoskeletal protein RodZ
MSNFGVSCKKARESKGISLDRIASETRISTRFLLAIENEEFNLLPGGIFNRGFVRAYAEKVGLDPDQAVADYERLMQLHQPPEASVAAARGGESDHHLYPVAIGALVLLIVIFYVVVRATHTAQIADQTAAPLASAIIQPAPAPPPAASTALLTPPTTPPEVTSTAPEPEPPVAPTEALRIDIEVTQTTWIKVDSDGTTVSSGEVLKPGTTRHFTAQNSIFLAVGNAGGLAFKINDMPAKSLGKNGQVRKLNITLQNFKSFIG